MRRLRRLLRNMPLMLVPVSCAFVIAALAGLRLMYAPVFKPLFAPTCMTLREEEVIPTLAVFSLMSGAMIAGLANLIVQSRKIRSLAAGLLIASLAFGIGVLAHSARRCCINEVE